MNVKIDWLRLLFVFGILLNISLVYAEFDICGVTINQPWFKVNDSEGNDIFIVDNEGDIYFEGVRHDNDVASITAYETFEFYDLFFNKEVSYIKSVTQNLSTLPNFEGTFIYGNDSIDKTLITKGGNIYTKGLTIYQHSQAACDPDGGYCSGSFLENRDYYCDILGGEVCTYDIVNSENCQTKLSDDTDSGRDYENYGEVFDYLDCDVNPGKGTDECGYNTYSDFCTGNSLTEYYTSGTNSYYSEVVDCSTLDFQYCSVDLVDKFQISYTCGLGQCDGDFPGIRVGDCLYWKHTGCSASCGGGTQTYVCTNSLTGATYSDATCIDIIGSKPNIACNTQACCTPYTVMIYNGDGNCAGACGSGTYCSSTSHENWGLDGAHWGPWNPGCSYRVRGGPGDCGAWFGATSCGSGLARVTLGTARCVCSC